MAWVVSWLPKSRVWILQVLDPKARSLPVSFFLKIDGSPVIYSWCCVCECVFTTVVVESHVVTLLACYVSDWRIQSGDQISRHSGTLEPSRYLDFDGRSGKIGSSLVEDAMVETAKKIL